VEGENDLNHYDDENTRQGHQRPCKPNQLIGLPRGLLAVLSDSLAESLRGAASRPFAERDAALLGHTNIVVRELLLGCLSERFPRCLDTYRISPAATVVQLPALRLHLFGVHATTAHLRSPVRKVALELARAVVTNAVTVEEGRTGEILTAARATVQRLLLEALVRHG
jgi:hypothetical protein